jgi:hypothetical protein
MIPKAFGAKPYNPIVIGVPRFQFNYPDDEGESEPLSHL